jgi:hypothetical protein
MRRLRGLLLALSALALAGCSEGLHVSDLRDRDLELQAYAGPGNARGFGLRRLSQPMDSVVFEISMGGRGEPSGDLKVTLNGRPMSYHCHPAGCDLGAAYQLVVHRDDFGAPENGLLELREGDDRVVMEVENLWAWRQFSPTPEELGTLHGGQQLDLQWMPETDRFSLNIRDDRASVSLMDVRSGESLFPVQDTALVGTRFQFQLPEELPSTEAEFSIRGRVNLPVLRCEGPSFCRASATAERTLIMQLP